MTCSSCSNEIADKALICYRCGQATQAPRVTPPSSGSIFAGRRRSRVPLLAWAAAGATALVAAYAAWAMLVP